MQATKEQRKSLIFSSNMIYKLNCLLNLFLKKIIINGIAFNVMYKFDKI
jgi:hypothetical protein